MTSTRKCCWVGGARYSDPLDKISAKKFRALKRIGENFVIGFSTDTRPRHFIEHAHFYLLPRWRVPVLRYLTFVTVSPIVILWLVRRYGVHILVAQSPYEGFSAACAKIISSILFKKKVALIVESHGDFEHFLFLQRKIVLSSFYRTIMKTMTSFALRNADALRAISNATRKQLETCSPGKPIVQFPAWTDIGVFLKAGEQKRNYRPTQTILFVGNLVPGKGVHVLLRSFARVADEFKAAKLILIGQPENQHYLRTLMMSARSHLAERIRFLGQLPQPQLAHHMVQASVLVIPSLSEGLGRVIFEAMASGTPVIGSRVGGIPDLITDTVTGFLVPPRDESALVNKISWILDNPAKTREMGLRAREFAENFFSSELYVQKYIQLLEIATLQEN